MHSYASSCTKISSSAFPVISSMALDNLLNIFDKKFKKNISEEFPKLNAQIVVLGLARIF